jgi:hypothetical protein
MQRCSIWAIANAPVFSSDRNTSTHYRGALVVRVQAPVSTNDEGVPAASNLIVALRLLI